MRKWVGVVAVFAMVAMLGFAVAQARVPDMTWTGWISDSTCSAEKGMTADHKGCALSCVKNRGASYVFVNSADKKVIKISNQDAVKDGDVGVELKVTGSIAEDGSLKISKIEATK
jgi:hypothetical protein